MNLRKAVENYKIERQRIVGGPHPTPSCQCGFCDVVRAADLLYDQAKAHLAARRWTPLLERRVR